MQWGTQCRGLPVQEVAPPEKETDEAEWAEGEMPLAAVKPEPTEEGAGPVESEPKDSGEAEEQPRQSQGARRALTTAAAFAPAPSHPSRPLRTVQQIPIELSGRPFEQPSELDFILYLLSTPPIS